MAEHDEAELGVAIPDVVGEIVGWRAWQVIGPPAFPLLYSVTYGSETAWAPNRWYEAVCHGRSHGAVGGGHEPPGERCSCGLYAAKHREHLLQMGYHHFDDPGSARRPVVIGEVGLVGKVIPGSQGWRAQKGRVRSLQVHFELWQLAEPLGRIYRVPVEVVNTFAAVAA